MSWEFKQIGIEGNPTAYHSIRLEKDLALQKLNMMTDRNESPVASNANRLTATLLVFHLSTN